MSSPKRKETPAQKIKRLEKELADERMKNKILNTMIDISDQQYGTAIRKLHQTRQVSLASSCRLFGISRQAVCQLEQRRREREEELSRIKPLIREVRIKCLVRVHEHCITC